MPDSLVSRIKDVAEVLAEVDDTPLEQIIEDFQRDAHPEREIQIWENIAYAYRKEVIRNPSMPLEQKKEVYGGLLQASMVVHPLKIAPYDSIDNVRDVAD